MKKILFLLVLTISIYGQAGSSLVNQAKLNDSTSALRTDLATKTALSDSTTELKDSLAIHSNKLNIPAWVQNDSAIAYSGIITATKIYANAIYDVVDTGSIANNTISGLKIIDNTIPLAKLADGDYGDFTKAANFTLDMLPTMPYKNFVKNSLFTDIQGAKSSHSWTLSGATSIDSVGSDTSKSYYSIKLPANTNPALTQLIQLSDYPELYEGQTISVSYWAYTTSSTVNARLWFYIRDASNNALYTEQSAFNSDLTVGTLSFAKVEGITIPSGASYIEMRFLNGSTGTGWVSAPTVTIGNTAITYALNNKYDYDRLIDNETIIRSNGTYSVVTTALKDTMDAYSTNINNFVKNPYFETRGTASSAEWTLYGSTSIVEVGIDTSKTRYALKLPASTNPSAIQTIYLSNYPQLKDSINISVSYWGFAETSTTNVRLWLYIYDESGTELYKEQSAFNADLIVGQLTQAKVENITIPANAYRIVLYYLNGSTGSGYLSMPQITIGSKAPKTYADNYQYRLNELETNQFSAVRDSVNFKISEYIKGSNIQNTMAKLMNANKGFANDTVRIVVMGDSRSFGTGAAYTSTWFYLDSLWLTQTFPNANIQMTNWSYGEYYLSHMHTKYFEDIAINPNVDLFIFHEYENETKLQLTLAEQIIKKIRSESTADIMINVPNPKESYSSMWVGREYYYYLAQKYNLEMWDVFQEFLNTVNETGNLLTDYLSDTVHPNALGYAIYANSFKEHFDTTKVISTANYAEDAIEYLELESGLMWLDSSKITYSGSWNITGATDSASGYTAYASTIGNYMSIPFNGTGFDLFYLDDATGGQFDIKVDDTYPSQIRVNGKALEYATPIIWDENNSNADRTHRPFKVIVKDTTTIGTYTIIMSDTANNNYLLFPPNAEKMTNGTFDNATGWTVPAGWTISGGVATSIGTSSALTHDNVLTPSKRVRISFDINRTSGTGTLLVRTYTTAYATISNVGQTSGKVFITYDVPAGSIGRIYFTPQTSWAGTIDNISILEGDSLGIGDFTTNFTSDNGDIYIPKTYAFTDNWLGEEAYDNGDKFYFTVKRNWVDNVDTDGVESQRRIIRVYGLENKAHTVKFTITGTGTTKFDAIKFFRPVLGRE